MTAILAVEQLTTRFATRTGTVSAVEDVTFEVYPGETFAIVGESGSGKSVTAYSILRLNEASAIVTGRVRFKNCDLLRLSECELRAIRGAGIAMIFQDPMTTLHPMLRIEQQMVDAILAHRAVSHAEARRQAEAALAAVNIVPADERLRAYPHQLSGGMRQRVAIAIAMLNRPDVIIADEPTTALDVTTQAQIITQMKALCAGSGTTLIWITHDLAVVAEIADRIAVMYAGNIVETGPADAVLSCPAHPYTAGLLASIPSNNPGSRRLPQIPGSLQSAATVGGCRFAPRCTRRRTECDVFPALASITAARTVRCVYPLPEREAIACREAG